METYYRFQNEKPKMGEQVHCFKEYGDFSSFVQMMKHQDSQFHRMKFWKITGDFIKEDEGDAIVRVHFAEQIYL